MSYLGIGTQILSFVYLKCNHVWYYNFCIS